jgi:NDMA-dependent alcohol dehydrogenase
MKTRAAVLRQAPGKWEITEVDLADPGPGEIQVKMEVAGLCHSDDHLATGDMPVGLYPVVGGHEGAGVVTAIGPGVTEFSIGDHAGILCVAGCGKCRWCAMGAQNFCDLNAELLSGGTPEDPSRYRMSIDGKPVGQMVAVSTFSEYTTVSTASAMKLDKDIPIEVAALVSCGVTTGWGAAVNSIGTRPGHTVMVIGIGGVGINAVQGARHAGASNIIAVDPNSYKTDRSMEFGATHTAASIEAGAEIARSLTGGQGADGAVVTIGVVQAEHVSQAFSAIRKGGTVAVVGLASMTESHPLDLSLAELTFYQKRLQGSLYGAASPRLSVMMLLDLYRSGQLKLDELITTTYELDDINTGYADMHAGKNLRGIIKFA